MTRKQRQGLMTLIIKAMATKYGFTPAQCAEMTLSQVEALLTESPEEAKNKAEGKITMTFEEARQFYGR